MKIMLRSSIVLILLFFTFPLILMSGETIKIPGDVNSISFYTKFFYNLPADDFLYYLNDRCLLSEDPDGRLFPTGIRQQLQKVIIVHNRIKEFIQENGGKDGNTITINLNKDNAFDTAEELISLLGLYLEKDKNGNYLIYVDDSAGVIDYYKFAMLDIDTMIKQLNKAKLLHVRMTDSDVAIPWDLQYVNEITGLDLDASSFFQTLVEDERLSLLLGILYRFSSKEMNFFDNLVTSPRLGAWKRIYQDTKKLVGLFMLSTALRVNDSRIMVPGGQEAEKFWSDLVGVDCSESPLEFIESLVTMEEGRLNYLYLFSFFLPESSRKAVLFDYNADKISELLPLIPLNKNERVNASSIPKLRDFNFFTLLYCLRVEDGRVQIPGGISAWMKAINKKKFDETAQVKVEMSDLFAALLEESSKMSTMKKMSALQKFMSLYTKFYDRPQLLTEEVISTLYEGYEDYNILVDFIEKIPVKKPETVMKLYNWVKRFGGVNKEDSLMFTAIFQSLLDILSHTAKYAPDKSDYDRLVEKLIAIPMEKDLFCDAIFQYLHEEFKIRLLKENIDRAFTNFVLSGVENRSLRFGGLSYRYMARELYRDLVKEIQQTQEVCTLSNLIEVMDLLDDIVKYNAGQDSKIEERLQETFLLLPQPDISDDAPKVIKERVIAYSRSSLEKNIKRFAEKIRDGATKDKLAEMANEIKGEFLLPHLKDYFLSMSYALNAKNPKLRFFINPNLIRLHDFDGDNGQTCWNFSGRPRSKVLERRGPGLFGEAETRTFSGYYLRGGLSRLNVELAGIWKDHLYGRNVIFDANHVKAFIANLLDFYPVPSIDKSQTYSSLLVEFGLELLQKSQKNENIRRDLIKELGFVTTGYHYKSILEYANGQKKDYYLFFSEIMALGERFFQQKKHLDEFSSAKKLEVFYGPIANKTMKSDLDQFGSIYYYTFGSLKPSRVNMFPQEVSNFFETGWTGGEMINEFKVKVAYHAHRKGIPPYLLGEFLYQYLDRTTRRYYSQNYKKDYFSTYFIFDIFNNSYLNKILKKAKEKGYLRIR